MDCVQAILYNFESSPVQSWINANHECLSTSTFLAFILEFKKNFLPRTWQDTLVASQIVMQSTTPFLTWTKSVCEANVELNITGSEYHIAENKLQSHFVPRLSPSLKLSYDAQNTHGNLDSITNLDEWIERVHLLDAEIDRKCQEWLKIAIKKGRSHQNKYCVHSTPVYLHNLKLSNALSMFIAKLSLTSSRHTKDASVADSSMQDTSLQTVHLVWRAGQAWMHVRTLPSHML